MRKAQIIEINNRPQLLSVLDSTGHCNSSASLSAGVIKPRVVDRLRHIAVSQQCDPFYAVCINIIKVLATPPRLSI